MGMSPLVYGVRISDCSRIYRVRSREPIVVIFISRNARRKCAVRVLSEITIAIFSDDLNRQVKICYLLCPTQYIDGLHLHVTAHFSRLFQDTPQDQPMGVEAWQACQDQHRQDIYQTGLLLPRSWTLHKYLHQVVP